MRMFSQPRVTIAFALGGLQGFNGHGIGFLDAARELEVEPSVISCTGSMIGWVATWLEGRELLPLLAEAMERESRHPQAEWLGRVWRAASGISGPLRPAVEEYWRRWLTPPAAAGDGAHDVLSPASGLAKAFLDRLMPAQILSPQPSPEESERIAAAINASRVPVVFNSFQPQTGRDFLHVNPAAAEFLQVEPQPLASDAKFKTVSPEAVAAAQWLHQYGFDERSNQHGLISGTYHRQFIIAELHMVNRIYAVRPINTRWIGELPANWFEMRDFTRRLWFNGAYYAETARMRLVNRLVETGRLSDELFRRIELIEVQVEEPYEDFGHAAEEHALYRRAAERAREVLGEREHASVPCGLPVPCTQLASRLALAEFLPRISNDICYSCGYYTDAPHRTREATHAGTVQR